MFKKGLIMLTLAIVMSPLLAQAYTLTTRINNLAGQLQVNAFPVQTSGSSIKAIPNGTNVNVVIAPAGGYSISRIQQGTTYLAVTGGGAGQTVNIPATNTASQTINVWFDAKKVPVTAFAGPGGSVSPAGTQNVLPGAAKSYVFTPATGNNVVSITGTPLGATCNGGSCAGSFAVNTPVIVAFTVPTTAVTMQGTFLSVIANAGASQAVIAGRTVTLDGSASVGASTYLWSQVTGRAVTLSSTSAVKPTFTSYTSAAAGPYQFKLVASAGPIQSTAFTSVNVGATLGAVMQYQCVDCHNGNGIGVVQSANYLQSTHANPSSPFSPGAACYQCHIGADNGAHPGVALNTILVDGKTDICATCHRDERPIGNFSIFTSASMLVMKAPHGQGRMSAPTGAVNVGDNITQYMTQGAVCADCHGHNNAINKGFAEGGHGRVSSDPLNAFAHYDWSARTNNGTRQAGNCDRCHTAGGFAKFLGDTAVATRLTPQAAPAPSAVLNCIGCHKSAEGELRTDAVVAGTVLSNGYFALFSSNTATLGTAPGNTKIQVAFPGYKNSSICIPCHSGRTTDTYVRNNIATIANYSTLQLSNYQHAFNMGQTFIGKGAWEFTPGKYASFAANQTPHTTIEMGAGQDQGPCVGCHYSTLSKTGVANATHSLEVNYTSNTCTPCHGAAGPQLAKFGEFSSARFALDTLVRAKMAPLNASGSTDLNVERGGYFRYGRFGKAPGVAADRTTAQNAYGAVYNWQLVKTWDPQAWAHNPAFARQIIFDTLAYLQTDGADLTGSPANVTAAIAAANAINAVNTTQATAFVSGNTNSDALCTGCHAVGRDAGAGYVQDNSGVRAITTEFGKWSHHVTGVTPNDAHCAACHMEGKASNGKIVVDAVYHMSGASTWLRNADTDAPIEWNPAAPNHTNMDNACMSCHDANGASSPGSAAIQAVINAAGVYNTGFTASALNPFGDTISNQYDQLSRGAVVAVKQQFDAGNSSHHGVGNAKYTSKNLTSAQFSNISTANAANNDLGVSRNTQPANVTLLATVGTMYETSKMTAYVPFGAATAVADNSVIHCADCHTVGQWKANTTNVVNDNGTLGAAVATVIGAHGSNNEYMLRNQDGSDVTANAKTAMVCYICHISNQYDGYTISATSSTHNTSMNHSASATITKYTATDVNCNGNGNNTMGKVLTNFTSSRVGINSVSQAQIAAGKYGTSGSSNPFANKCLNCHNAGVDKNFGGIHGNAIRVANTAAVNLNVGYKSYSGANGATPTAPLALTAVDRKPYRFLPGLGNFRYNGGTDSNAWTRKTFGTAGKSERMGCYTLNGTSSKRVSGISDPSGLYGSDYTGSAAPTKAIASGTNVSNNAIATDQSRLIDGPSADSGILGSWGGCAHHAGASTGPTTGLTRTSIRPLTY